MIEPPKGDLKWADLGIGVKALNILLAFVALLDLAVLVILILMR